MRIGTWQVDRLTLVALVAAVTFPMAAVLIWAPDDSRAIVITGLGAIGPLVLALLGPLVRRAFSGEASRSTIRPPAGDEDTARLGRRRRDGFARVDLLAMFLWCAVLALLGMTAVGSTGCTPAEQAAFRDTIKPVVDVGCEVARKIVLGCGFVEPVLGTSGGDTGDEEPRTIDGEDPAPGEP